jgi:ribosomal protein S18 acetylase RimI-like enzyme
MEMKGSISIRKLCSEDCKIISESFSDIGWNKPESIYQQYLVEQNEALRYCFIAEKNNQFVGYVTLSIKSKYEYFRRNNIIEISDLNVLPKFRNQAIATALIKKCENHAYKIDARIGLGVGLTRDYANAINLYLKIGYKFDGNGIAYKGRTLKYQESAVIDDDLNMYLIKNE